MFFFIVCREVGVINIGGLGIIEVVGVSYDLGNEEVFYIGKGNDNVVFFFKDVNNLVKYYFNFVFVYYSYLCKKIGELEVNVLNLGS